MSREITLTEVRSMLRAHVARKYETQAKAAKELDLSTAYVSAVLSGAKRPSAAMLADAGISRKVSYHLATPAAGGTRHD